MYQNHHNQTGALRAAQHVISLGNHSAAAKRAPSGCAAAPSQRGIAAEMLDGRRPLIVAFLLGVLTMTAVTQLTMTPKTSLGRRKATQERAFVLNVGLTFRSQGVADGFIKEWAKAADYCLANEDFLFAYELAQSDQDPLRYLITERYRSKADYLGAHRSSSAFKVTRRPRAACASARASLQCPRAPCHAC